MISNNIDAKSLLQANATIIAGLLILISIIGTLADTQPSDEQETYLFTWNYTISGDSKNIPPRLVEYITDKYSITWLDTATIDKDDKVITITYDTNAIMIELGEQGANLTINDINVEKLNVKIDKVHNVHLPIVSQETVDYQVSSVIPFIASLSLAAFTASIIVILKKNIKVAKGLFVGGLFILTGFLVVLTCLYLEDNCIPIFAGGLLLLAGFLFVLILVPRFNKYLI